MGTHIYTPEQCRKIAEFTSIADALNERLTPKGFSWTFNHQTPDRYHDGSLDFVIGPIHYNDSSIDIPKIKIPITSQYDSLGEMVDEQIEAHSTMLSLMKEMGDTALPVMTYSNGGYIGSERLNGTMDDELKGFTLHRNLAAPRTIIAFEKEYAADGFEYKLEHEFAYPDLLLHIGIEDPKNVDTESLKNTLDGFRKISYHVGKEDLPHVDFGKR